MKKECRVLVLGSGPAGYTAGLYTARAGLHTILLTGPVVGGQLTTTSAIENFPPFMHISGMDLMNQFHNQALKIGIEIIADSAIKVDLKAYPFQIQTENFMISAKSIIIATGAAPKWLNISGEENFKGKGISVCAVCDGFFLKNKIAAVIGAGNSAIYEALYLSKIAKTVFLINNQNSFHGETINLNKLQATPNIIPIMNASVLEFQGKTNLEKIIYSQENIKKELMVQGAFEAIGQIPNTFLFQNQLKLDENGFIQTDSKMQTSIPGVFACGDAQAKEYRQAIIACGTGAIAALSAESFLKTIS